MADPSVFDWLQVITLGGLMGVIGQGARTVVGLKKLHDAASSASVAADDLFVASRVFVSLAIGFIAGGVAGITLVDLAQGVSPDQLFTLAAAGYAGTDFIEGFMSRVSGSPSTAKGEDSIGVGGAAATDAADAADGAMG